jgi:DNA-binding transcriptional regulator GbsR (MarR family)
MGPERRFADRAGVVLVPMGMPAAVGRILGWLLICTPSAQSGAEISAALQLSKGAVSTGLKLLETTGLARRAPMPGRRGIFYESAPDAFMRATVSDSYATFEALMNEGIELAGGEDSPAARRLRVNRDFFAYLDRELRLLVQRFQDEHPDY